MVLRGVGCLVSNDIAGHVANNEIMRLFLSIMPGKRRMDDYGVELSKGWMRLGRLDSLATGDE